MRMNARMKKRQVINHRFRSVSHSAFVTTYVEKPNFYKYLEQVLDWEDSFKKLDKSKKDKTDFVVFLFNPSTY